MTTPRDLNSYTHCYLVNLYRQPNQIYPTFTAVIRDAVTRKFPRMAGQNMEGMALYYTDEVVDEGDMHSLTIHTTRVTRGGPNVVKPDTDDAAIMKAIRDGGNFSADALQAAIDNADVMKAQLAADGHFKFNLL